MTTIPKITCPSLNKITHINHAFLTRNGGVSHGIYKSLNCGPGSNDDKDHVAENRKIAVGSLGGNARLITIYQVHSNRVVNVTADFNERPEADAMVTKCPDIAIGILTADCTPVLFADSKNKIIGAAHAGWKGAFSGILENTIEEMGKLGAEQKNICAAIGPTIHQPSYEVGAEFYDRFMDADKNNAVFFIPSEKDGHHMFDLPAYVAARLTKAGITSVTDVKRDTCAEAENFFSYRRKCLTGEEDYGRNLSLICIR